MRKLIVILAFTAAVLSVGYTTDKAEVDCEGYFYNVWVVDKYLKVTVDREVLVDEVWGGPYHMGKNSWPTVRPNHTMTIQIGDEVTKYTVKGCKTPDKRR